MYQLKYPIGQADIPLQITSQHITNWIKSIELLPQKLTTLVSNLTQKQLDTPYRPEGWTIRQVVHHLYDSHHNSYIRFKWALTENNPIIKVYDEKLWAELDDAKTAPIQLSLGALSALHAKWTYFLKTLDTNQLNKTFVHPESGNTISLKENIGIYAWHGEHHYAHILNKIKLEHWAY